MPETVSARFVDPGRRPTPRYGSCGECGRSLIALVGNIYCPICNENTIARVRESIRRARASLLEEPENEREAPIPEILREQPRQPRYIQNYDCDPLNHLTFIGKPKNGLFFGVEHEIEPRSGKNSLAERICKDFANEAICVHDGSLYEGFEVVTAPMEYSVMKDFHKRFFEKDYQYESFNSDRCSTHVHMSRVAFTPLQIAKMKVFCYAKSNRGFIEQIAGRTLQGGWGARYAKLTTEYKLTDIAQIKNYEAATVAKLLGVPIPDIPLYLDKENLQKFIENYGLKKVKPELATKKLNEDRYHAVNLDNIDTVEIRIFKGCNKANTMFKNLEFCKALFDFTKENVVSISKIDNSAKDFINYSKTYSKMYPNLIKYLQKNVGI